MSRAQIAKIAKKNADSWYGLKLRSERAFSKLARSEEADDRDLCTRWNNICGVNRVDEAWKAAAATDAEFMKLYTLVVASVDVPLKRENLKAFFAAWPEMKERIAKAVRS